MLVHPSASVNDIETGARRYAFGRAWEIRSGTPRRPSVQSYPGGSGLRIRGLGGDCEIGEIGRGGRNRRILAIRLEQSPVVLRWSAHGYV